MKLLKLIILLFLPILLILFLQSAFAAKKKIPWDSNFEVGDTVCIYDIAKADPLVHNRSNHSLKYWYRANTGKQKNRYELRPIAKKLQLKVLWPGLKRDKAGWYSGNLVVIKGGKEIMARYSTTTRGHNRLIVNAGRTYVSKWQVINFTQAKFKKKFPALSCTRTYPKY